MDFLVGLPRTRSHNDYIFVVLVKSNYSAKEYARIYINMIMSFHGIPLSIIMDRSVKFMSGFWRSFRRGLGTKVKLSTAFHSQMDGQADSTIQTLEDML